MGDRIEDRVPAWIRGELNPDEAREVEIYLARCEDAREEESVVRALRESTVRIPAGLDERIKAAVAADRPSGATAPTTRVRSESRSPIRWLSAAAVVMIAVAVSVFWNDRGVDPLTDTDLAALDPVGEVWTSDDNVVAGAPLLEGLSDETLSRLLSELGG